MNPSPQEVTRLLLDWRHGDRAAFDRLMPLVYGELRRRAQRYMGRERRGHTLQATALVHETYLKLADHRSMQWQNRAHFFAIAAQVMRRLLMDHARRRKGRAREVILDEGVVISEDRAAQWVAIDEALKKLAAIDPRKSQLVELRYFGGLSVEEAAEVLGVSAITVKREWLRAKTWLARELSTAASHEDDPGTLAQNR